MPQLVSRWVSDKGKSQMNIGLIYYNNNGASHHLPRTKSCSPFLHVLTLSFLPLLPRGNPEHSVHKKIGG